MKRPDPVEQALDRLSAIKSGADTSTDLVKELKPFFKNRSNLVVAKAAKIVGERHIKDLLPELPDTFHRLMANPEKLDKSCAATTEIVAALYELDYLEPDIYLLGIRHIQMEGAYGPPVDAAAKLRGLSALGLVRTRHPQALDEVVPLLVDAWFEARIGAVKALASNGGHAGMLLLKLKILAGENDPEILAECFTGLLANAPENVPLIACFVDSEDPAIAEAALLALGASRLPAAFDFLKEKYDEIVDVALRKTLLLAMATCRSEAAIEFLLGVLEESRIQTAEDALVAMTMFRSNDNVRSQIETIVAQRNEKRLNDLFRQEF